ncbi:MAG TPA: adenosylcobinamide-phosphate synthase CbiB [Rectinemataceae bacterium]|nr:adenosylcobinamide-phosphate synthase CbiB [Rectinemataceae bacterium]
MTAWYIIVAALILDGLIGDPEYAFHPVRLIGRAAARLEAFLRPRLGATIGAGLAGWLIAVGGACLAGIALPGIAAALAALVCRGIGIAREPAAKVAALVTRIVLIYTTIAPRDMAKQALRVSAALEKPGMDAQSRLEAGQASVSRIVGRDARRLDREGVVKAAVESVAESTIDGVIAPLFWALIAGAPGALAYRAINTLDSMWGYKNERYLRFGRVAARADDAANWIPARLGFLFGLFACGLLSITAPGRFSLKAALTLGWRDRRNHESPNSAWMEALTAGALGIRLAGPAWYEGKKIEKPYLGEARRPPETADIGRSILIMYLTTILFASTGCLILLALSRV